MKALEAIDILLVEDNPGDVELTLEALREARLKNRVHVSPDGVAAMEFLRRQGEFADAPRPDLILLDLNMPRKDGREVLRDVKGDADLCRIPVVVLTTSDDERDVLDAYDLRANAYIVKPVDIEQFFRAIQALEGFWLAVVRLPGS